MICFIYHCELLPVFACSCSNSSLAIVRQGPTEYSVSMVILKGVQGNNKFVDLYFFFIVFEQHGEDFTYFEEIF